jgi:hypothetical protein
VIRRRHCEERSDEAIQGTESARRSLDCFASLAMTGLSQFQIIAALSLAPVLSLIDEIGHHRRIGQSRGVAKRAILVFRDLA